MPGRGDDLNIYIQGIPGIAAPQTFHCLAFVLFVVYVILLFRWQRQDRLPIRLLEASLCAFAIGN